VLNENRNAATPEPTPDTIDTLNGSVEATALPLAADRSPLTTPSHSTHSPLLGGCKEPHANRAKEKMKGRRRKAAQPRVARRAGARTASDRAPQMRKPRIATMKLSRSWGTRPVLLWRDGKGRVQGGV
jgi:hypothetical protein